jgi:hypothetical protein
MSAAPFYCTADEVAWAIVIATRHMDDPVEFGKDPEWIVTRAHRAGSGFTESSRAAYYALEALYLIRPMARHQDIAVALGFQPKSANGAYTQIAYKKRGGWWCEKTAWAIRSELAETIGVMPYEPPEPAQRGGYTHGMKAEPPQPPVEIPAFLPPRQPAPPPLSIPEQIDIISTAVAPPAPPSAKVLRDAVSIPLRSAATKTRRPLSPAEAARNAALLGDPPVGRSALAQRERGE